MPSYVLNSFRGGISDYENKGLPGAYKFAKNHDPRKLIDSISCQQALTDDLASGFTATPYFAVVASDGLVYIAMADKIYTRTTSSIYTLVYTDPDGTIVGMAESYNHTGDTFISWATATKLKRKRIIGTGYTNTDWTDANNTINAQSYPKTNLTSAPWHTMKFILGGLYGVNDDKLFLVSSEDDSYTNQIVRFAPGCSQKTLEEVRAYMYTGSTQKGGEEKADLTFWDGLATKYLQRYPMPASAINAIAPGEYPLIQIGTNGQLYYLAEDNSFTPVISFPNGGQVNPQGVAINGGLTLFGVFGNGTGKTGIYSYGRKKKNASPVLNLEYQFDCDEIGFVIKVGADILFSFKSGSTYGVKKVDTSNKAIAVFETIDLEVSAIEDRMPVWKKAIVTTKPLPAGCSIGLQRRMNKTATWLPADISNGVVSFNAENDTQVVFNLSDSGTLLEGQFTLTPNGNATPEILKVEFVFE